jgi:DNA-binding MarR family transcriptional regulator
MAKAQRRPEKQVDLGLFSRAVELLREKVDTDLQLTTLAALLFVAERGTVSQKELEEALGVNNASASRNVSYWTHRRHDRKPGMGFIDRRVDDHDQRYRKLTLTKAGEEFARKLKEL